MDKHTSSVSIIPPFVIFVNKAANFVCVEKSFFPLFIITNQSDQTEPKLRCDKSQRSFSII